jgi:hypothetical protein
MRLEQHVVDRAAGLFATWLGGVLQRPEYRKDRRAGKQRFEDVIERVAKQTAQQGVSVSVVVIAAGQARFHPGLLREWVADIRNQLRAADLVGTLTESEIALLLPETTPAGAASVVERLRSQVGVGQGRSLLPPSIGIATRSAEWPPETPIVMAAREHARRRECA